MILLCFVALKIGLLQYQEEVEDCDTKRKLPFSARLKPYLEYRNQKF